MALINSSPENCQSRLEITIFILVGCLGYSNSAMNPILYAFLSDNFKKSFMKAFTCAKSNDINAQLHQENSQFPRFGRGKNSISLTAKPSAKLIANLSSQGKSKLMQSTKFSNNVESAIEVRENGNRSNGHHVNMRSCKIVTKCDDEYEDDIDKRPEDAICSSNPVNGMSKPPILNTDL